MIAVSGEIETAGQGAGGARTERTGETREAQEGSGRKRGRAAGESPGGAEMRSDEIVMETRGDPGETAEAGTATKMT